MTTLKDIRVRPITDDDFPEISEWFVKRRWSVPPVGKMLPETGYVAVSGEKLLAVAWLYITNSQVGIIDWIATNPEAGIAGLVSVKKLVEYMEAVSAGSANVFMHFTPNDKFARYLKGKCRFKITEKANVCVRRRPLEAGNG